MSEFGVKEGIAVWRRQTGGNGDADEGSEGVGGVVTLLSQNEPLMASLSSMHESQTYRIMKIPSYQFKRQKYRP